MSIHIWYYGGSIDHANGLRVVNFMVNHQDQVKAHFLILSREHHNGSSYCHVAIKYCEKLDLPSSISLAMFICKRQSYKSLVYFIIIL